MKLDYLRIEDFKNLRNFEVKFDEKPDELFTVLLGQNGLGKSNLLEALVIIFRDLFRGNQTEFGYELRYTLKRGTVKIAVQNIPSAESWQSRFSFTATQDDGTKKEVFRLSWKWRGSVLPLKITENV
jgi:recombinational DNA repair ATPase RecF